MDSLAALAHVRYRKQEQIAWVTLDRPGQLNALNLQMHHELSLVWDDLEADEQIRVAVLTGAGDRAFSVGQDLKERARLGAEGSRGTTVGSRGLSGYPRLTERFGMRTPVIAAVHGYALGGGFELALACDLVIASEQAVFALPEARLGLVPGAGGVFRLTRQMAPRPAMGYLLTGRQLSAPEALGFGLVNEVTTAEKLLERAESWALEVAASAPLSVRAIREMFYRSADLSLPEAFSAEYAAEAVRRDSLDAQEGPAAFTQKRPPRWRGR